MIFDSLSLVGGAEGRPRKRRYPSTVLREIPIEDIESNYETKWVTSQEEAAKRASAMHDIVDIDDEDDEPMMEII